MRFGFADYGRLTIIGVILASLAWPVMTPLSSEARRPFLLLMIIVTVVGFATDVWITLRGQSVEAVWVLVVMHVALALITYPGQVLIAP